MPDPSLDDLKIAMEVLRRQMLDTVGHLRKSVECADSSLHEVQALLTNPASETIMQDQTNAERVDDDGVG